MDCFAGTGVVSYYMIQKGVRRVITNDIQHYSAIISSVSIASNSFLSSAVSSFNSCAWRELEEKRLKPKMKMITRFNRIQQKLGNEEALQEEN
jgi:adenine-specific DNA methylase